MSLHHNREHFTAQMVPHAGHRLFAAAFMAALPTLVLTTTLWTLAGTCAPGAAFAAAAALIFAGFLPFSVSRQFQPGTALSATMRRAQVVLMALFFAAFLAAGPGAIFLGAPCGSGMSVVQSALIVAATAPAAWYSLHIARRARA